MADHFETKIKEIIQRAHNVKSFRLERKRDSDFKAGQFMCVSLKTDNQCKRYLSISSSPTEKDYIEFTKKLTQSDFSTALNGLKPGDLLMIQYPLGKFVLEDTHTKIAFLSGGIGITPIRSICKYVVDKRLNADITLLYANHSINDIVFKEDFEVMQKQFLKLKVCHVLSELAPGFECISGRINGQIIKNEIPDYVLRKFYICGPPLMVESMRKILSDELSLPEENITTENFVGY